MKRLINLIIVLLVCCYPFAIYFGLNHFPLRYIALALAFIFLLRYIITKPQSHRSRKPIIFATAIGLIACVAVIITNQSFAIRLYPVMMSLFMFALFFYSLSHPPTVIERLARLKTKALPDDAIDYLWKVTIVWCCFFVVNGAIALWTVLFASLATWTLYNGLLSYLLMGCLFIGELLFRLYYKRKIAHNEKTL